MKINSGKLSMSITFGEFETLLIQETARKVIGGHERSLARNEMDFVRKDFKRILTLAVLAYCRGALQSDGKIENMPLIAEKLRHENPTEIKDRVDLNVKRKPNLEPGMLLKVDLPILNDPKLSKKIRRMNVNQRSAFIEEMETIIAVAIAYSREQRSSHFKSSDRQELSEAELRYCEMEAIDPKDYQSRKKIG